MPLLPVDLVPGHLAVDTFRARVPVRHHQHAAIVLGALRIAAAFVPGRNAVLGVTLPHDIDEFRDIAAAQAIADGNGLQDPYYRDETIWYNPLLGAVVAAISRMSGTAVPATYVRQGHI